MFDSHMEFYGTPRIESGGTGGEQWDLKVGKKVRKLLRSCGLMISD